MAGILGGYSDPTCNAHNALRNISDYACGVTFLFKTEGARPDFGGYGVVSLEECCAKVGRPVLRIPGNAGCEMQFCEVPGEETTTTATTVDAASSEGPPQAVENCVGFVYEGDLPDDVAQGVANVGSWCVVRMYDDALSAEDEESAVTASAAPASWTEAAAGPFDKYWSSVSAAAAASSTPTSTAEAGTSGGVGGEELRVCALRGSMAAALLFIGLITL